MTPQSRLAPPPARRGVSFVILVVAISLPWSTQLASAQTTPENRGADLFIKGPTPWIDVQESDFSPAAKGDWKFQTGLLRHSE